MVPGVGVGRSEGSNGGQGYSTDFPAPSLAVGRHADFQAVEANLKRQEVKRAGVRNAHRPELLLAQLGNQA